MHGRWNRGSRGSSCSPNFWHGRAAHSSCCPKSLSLLHCDVRLSRIDLDILEYCRSVERSRTKKLSASGGFAPRPPLEARAPRARHGPGHCLLPQLSNTSNALVKMCCYKSRLVLIVIFKTLTFHKVV